MENMTAPEQYRRILAAFVKHAIDYRKPSQFILAHP